MTGSTDQEKEKREGGRACWICGEFIRAGESHECQGPRKPRPKHTYRRRSQGPLASPGATNELNRYPRPFRTGVRIQGA